MSKNIADLCFRASDGLQCFSGQWRLWITRHGDIYLANRADAGARKFSFHRSGVCRYASTAQFGNPPGQSDRVLQRWQRPHIPMAGSKRYARLAWIAVPTDYLSRGSPKQRKHEVFVPPAAPGHAVVVEVALTNDRRVTIEQVFDARPERGLCLYSPVFDSVSAFVCWSQGTWENDDFRVPPSHGLPGYRFLASEAEHPHRPIRFATIRRTANFESLIVTEVGGCTEPNSDASPLDFSA